MLVTRFWDLAGRATREIDINLKNTTTMALPTITADQILNAQMNASFIRNIRIAYSITSDVGVAEVVQYPFDKNHLLTTLSDTTSQCDLLLHKESRQSIVPSDGEDLTQLRRFKSSNSSVHSKLSVAHLAPSVTIFLSSINAFAYSMAHKIESDVGNSLFTTLVLICESLDSIESDEYLMDVAACLDE